MPELPSLQQEIRDRLAAITPDTPLDRNTARATVLALRELIEHNNKIAMNAWALIRALEPDTLPEDAAPADQRDMNGAPVKRGEAIRITGTSDGRPVVVSGYVDRIRDVPASRRPRRERGLDVVLYDLKVQGIPAADTTAAQVSTSTP